ncbi:FAD-dependent monooxygenase, partial [Staphylococcus aureus]
LARFEGEDTKIGDKHGHIYFEEDAEGEGGRPEIDRGELCELIQNKIEPGRIHYGYEFESMETLEDGHVKVNFKYSDDFNHIEQQETEVFDLVIG